jgi:electron transfer flavoprotein beta subunit
MGGQYVSRETPMNIIVCVKEVIDPEAPAEEFRLDVDKGVLVPSPKILKVSNPFDEQAVEAALRIKDKSGARVTIVTLGKGFDPVVVKKPLVMGADELVLLDDEAFVDGDSWSTAYALAVAIKKIGSYDLILCGRQAGDWNAGQVGLGIAEFLGLPSVSIARRIDVTDGQATVERVIRNGYEVVSVALPALITLSNELGQPRYPSITNMRKANKIQPLIWKPSDIGLDPSVLGSRGRRLKLIKLFQPVFEGTCEMIGGETPQEAGENLALRLRKERVL